MKVSRVLTFVFCATIFVSTAVFAVDGVVLINQATVIAAGGFPYKITQPGSYKLSGNLVVPADTDGIDMFADNVLLDLNGFTISGPGSCSGPIVAGRRQPITSCSGNSGFASGIDMSSNSTVRNGSVTGMAFGIVGTGLIEEVHTSNNSATGIQAGSAIVRRCTADSNGGAGFFVFDSTMADSEASLNGGDGLAVEGGTVTGNSLHQNGLAGLDALNTVYGTNYLRFNLVVDVRNDPSNVSQNNNICTQGPC